MDNDTKMKLTPILLRSKLGQFVSEEEHEFARRCWREWPKEYSALQTDEVNPEAAKHIPALDESISSTVLSRGRLARLGHREHREHRADGEIDRPSLQSCCEIQPAW